MFQPVGKSLGEPEQSSLDEFLSWIDSISLDDMRDQLAGPNKLGIQNFGIPKDPRFGGLANDIRSWIPIGMNG